MTKKKLENDCGGLKFKVPDDIRKLAKSRGELNGNSKSTKKTTKKTVKRGK